MQGPNHQVGERIAVQGGPDWESWVQVHSSRAHLLAI